MNWNERYQEKLETLKIFKSLIKRMDEAAAVRKERDDKAMVERLANCHEDSRNAAIMVMLEMNLMPPQIEAELVRNRMVQLDEMYLSNLGQKTEVVVEWLRTNNFPETVIPINYVVPKSLLDTTTESEDELEERQNRSYRKRYRKTSVIAKSPKKYKMRKTRRELDKIRRRALRSAEHNHSKYYRK